MNYKLDGIPISNYGAKPLRTDQAFALHGMFDLPKRVGKTEHNWGTSIEPFVHAEDIQLDGRNMALHVALKKAQLDNFLNACIECTTLSTSFDTFNVVCRDEIRVDRFGDEWRIVEVPFWQNDYQLKSLTVSPSGGELYTIDDYNLPVDFGAYISTVGGSENIGNRIEVETTEFYQRSSFRSTRNVNITGVFKGINPDDLYAKVCQLHALLMKPGLRELVIRNKKLNVYFKSGMTATAFKEDILQFNLIASVGD